MALSADFLVDLWTEMEKTPVYDEPMSPMPAPQEAIIGKHFTFERLPYLNSPKYADFGEDINVPIPEIDIDQDLDVSVLEVPELDMTFDIEEPSASNVDCSIIEDW